MAGKLGRDKVVSGAVLSGTVVWLSRHIAESEICCVL